MINREKHSTSVVIRKMQTEAALRLHLQSEVVLLHIRFIIVTWCHPTYCHIVAILFGKRRQIILNLKSCY